MNDLSFANWLGRGLGCGSAGDFSDAQGADA